MGKLTFSLNLTLDGCVHHEAGIADDETHAFFTQLMDSADAMLWGRTTYEMMESYWPGVARGERAATPKILEWAIKLETKPKYVVSSKRSDFPWPQSHHVSGDLKKSVQKIKDENPKGILLGSSKLAQALDDLDLIDEYVFLLHPRITGHGPRLFESGIKESRKLELVSVKGMKNGAVILHYKKI